MINISKVLVRLLKSIIMELIEAIKQALLKNKDD
tara:strand:+ start:3317 stop:3418 length:102 start_codon:yes stop_codon:yes gene_type:complete